MRYKFVPDLCAALSLPPYRHIHTIRRQPPVTRPCLRHVSYICYSVLAYVWMNDEMARHKQKAMHSECLCVCVCFISACAHVIFDGESIHIHTETCDGGSGGFLIFNFFFVRFISSGRNGWTGTARTAHSGTFIIITHENH